MNFADYDPSHIFSSTQVSVDNAVAQWFSVPSDDIGASAEPSVCTVESSQ